MTRKLVSLAVASVFLLGLAACSDDDDGQGFGFPAGQGTTQPGANPFGGGDPNAEGGAGAGYTQASHDNFVNECVGFPGATGDVCECAWGTITQTVSYADWQVFETGYAQGNTALPEWLTSAVAGCA